MENKKKNLEKIEILKKKEICLKGIKKNSKSEGYCISKNLEKKSEGIYKNNKKSENFIEKKIKKNSKSKIVSYFEDKKINLKIDLFSRKFKILKFDKKKKNFVKIEIFLNNYNLIVDIDMKNQKIKEGLRNSILINLEDNKKIKGSVYKNLNYKYYFMVNGEIRFVINFKENFVKKISN